MHLLIYSEHLSGGGGTSTKTTIEYLRKLGHTVIHVSSCKDMKLKKADFDLILHHNIAGMVHVSRIAHAWHIPIVFTVNNLITCMNGTHLKNKGPYGAPYERANFFSGILYQARERYVRPWNERLFSFLNYPYRYLLMKRRIAALNSAAGIIAISPTIQKLLKANGVTTEIFVSPQPIDDSLIHVSRDPKGYVFYMGGWEPFKGIDLLMAALTSTMDKPPLCVAGETRPAQKVQSRITYPNTTILGRISKNEMILRYAQCRLFIFPSLWQEAYGRGWAEAMCVGAPIIAIDRGGPGDYIQHGKTGFLSTPEKLSTAIDILLNDSKLTDTLGKNAKEYARHNLIASVVVPHLVEYYERVLQRTKV